MSNGRNSPNPNGSYPEPTYVELPTRDPSNNVPDSPFLGELPSTPQLPAPSTPPLHSPSSPAYLHPFSPPPGMNQRDSFLAPAPSFMSFGGGSDAGGGMGGGRGLGGGRHDSYMSYASDEGFLNKRGSYVSQLSSQAETPPASRPGALSPSPLALGALAAGSQDEPHPVTEGVEDEKPVWAGGKKKWSSKKKRWVIIGSVLGLIVVALGVGLGIGLWKNNQNKNSNTGSGSSNGSHSENPSSPTRTTSSPGAQPSATGPIRGIGGSLITLTNGTQTTYVNPHGGVWAYDPYDPLLNDARPNSWTPPLNQSWDWSQIINGVNLGGWFVTEPFIVPGLYEAFPNGTAGTSVDEYTLSINMGDQLATAMENHYATFITEEDFMQIAAAGLNWIRLPIGFWALETWDGEPFLEGVAWKYIVQALGWARKYGIRVNLDLHATPGSQNGWNHSGRIGSTNWMKGVMGLANLQRSIDIIETLFNFIIQPEWKDVVPMFGILNEPRAEDVSHNNLGAFYLEIIERIRSVTGTGEGKGPVVSIFEGFEGVGKWYGFAQEGGSGLDRAMLDVHQYTVFQDQDRADADTLSHKACSWWASGATSTNNTMNQFGLTNTGEWSLAWNDCGQWVNGVGLGTRYEGSYNGYTGPVLGSCEEWMQPQNWNATIIAAMKNTYLAGVDALQSNFFWTWKIGSTTAYANPAPAWSYKLGLQMGWIPNDPREAIGYCESNNLVPSPTAFTGYQPFMTGGVGAGTIPAAASSQYAWPLTQLVSSVSAGTALFYAQTDLSRLPQYTRTAAPMSAPTPTFTDLPSSISSQLVPTASLAPQSAFTAVAGCTYPNEYSGNGIPIPTSACGAGQSASQAFYKRAQITAAPQA